MQNIRTYYSKYSHLDHSHCSLSLLQLTPWECLVLRLCLSLQRLAGAAQSGNAAAAMGSAIIIIGFGTQSAATELGNHAVYSVTQISTLTPDERLSLSLRVPARNNNLRSKVIRKFLAREGQAIHEYVRGARANYS